MSEQTLSNALKHVLSGVRFDPARQQAVLAYVKGERIMKRKLTVLFAAVIAAMLLAGTALAAGLGLFGQFAGEQEGESSIQLGLLEHLATTVDETKTLTAGGREVTLTLRQAYCDGHRLYYSYEITGASVGDGADLPDGSSTMIYDSGERELEGGAVAGYQMVELPEGCEVGETLEFLLPVVGEPVSFSVPVTRVEREPMGAESFGHYAATVMMNMTDDVLYGAVTITCPEEWTTLVAEGGEGDCVVDFVLTSYGQRYENQYPALRVTGDGTMDITVLFDRPENPVDLNLIPVYRESGEKPAETISVFPGNA